MFELTHIYATFREIPIFTISLLTCIHLLKCRNNHETIAIENQNYCSKRFLKTEISVKVMVLEPMLVKT